jgi:hypothetical protein
MTELSPFPANKRNQLSHERACMLTSQVQLTVELS